MNGAHLLVHTLLDAGVDTCFTNPGTSEMHFVAALDQVPGMRCVLGLFEGVVTGAADGYFRMSGRPASTLLHLGPGLANGLANLHNAKKAGSGIVNIVGDHATAHLALDAPLTSDIAGVAAPMSHWVRAGTTVEGLAVDGREAVVQARARPGRIATLTLPADLAWGDAATPAPALGPVARAEAAALDDAAVQAAAQALRADGAGTLLLLGGEALREAATNWAGRVSAATGCAVMSEFYGARLERGAGRVATPRVPYAVEPALAALAPFRHIVLVGAREPVAFFAYPGKPGRLAAPGTRFTVLATPQHDAAQALEALADAVGARQARLPVVERASAEVPDGEGALTPATLGELLAALLPEQAIVVDEGVSTGRGFDRATRGAAPHDWLTGMGGSIGFGLPAALGAAVAAPGRKVIALTGDGSAMYTLQALWTMAREGLDVTVVVFANRAYQILRGEFAGVGAGAPGPRATDMLTLDRPDLDWLALARGMGVQATRAATVGTFVPAWGRAMAQRGPVLIEAVV
jgi:acetolactate synthase-1/2/3 large subunit